MADALTIEALSPAALAHALSALPHETRATVTATENGQPWAVLSVSPLTDSARSVFPLDATGVGGDTRKRGQSGVMLFGNRHSGDNHHALILAVNRARRMFNA